MRESLSHINLSKLVNILTSALFFHSLHIVVLGLPLLSPLVALLSPLVLKWQKDLSIILLLFYGTIFHLVYVSLFITSLLLFQTRLCLIFQPVFSLTSSKLFLPPLVCIYLGYLRTDIAGIDQASSFHLTHISLSFTPIFMLFDF